MMNTANKPAARFYVAVHHGESHSAFYVCDRRDGCVVASYGTREAAEADAARSNARDAKKNPPGTHDQLVTVRDARGVRFAVSARSAETDTEVLAFASAFYGREMVAIVERVDVDPLARA